MITFNTEHAGSIMMFDEPARALLRMMGTSASVKGALLAEDVPAALASLEAALQGLPPEAVGQQGDAEEGEKNETKDAVLVTLAQRAVPLRDLLRRAVETESYVSWGP